MIRWSILDFCTWLCEREGSVVGSNHSWFRSPLARYLRERVGQPYYVDGQVYGPLAADVSWTLPAWAQQVHRLLNGRPEGVFTGEEVFEVLASVERC